MGKIVKYSFLLNCKLCGLRDQSSLGQDNVGTYIDFQGNTSKNFSGGLNQRKIEAKSIGHYSSISDEISLYKTYMELTESSENRPFYRYLIHFFLSKTIINLLLLM